MKEYYPELDSTDKQLPAEKFETIYLAVEEFKQRYGDDVIAVVEDDGDGNLTVISMNNGE